MSVLETPRIYFKGKIAWDPVTTNNYPVNYDEDTCETVYQTAHDRVQAFRRKAIEQVLGEDTYSWNPDGTYRSPFYESTVCGFDLGNGVETNDPFMAAPAAYTGMLVDAEPYGPYSSQLFFNSMLFGIKGGYRILLPRTSRMTDRYINFSRTPTNNMIAGVASVVWQTSFAKADGLTIDAFDSPALQRLQAALNQPGVRGLTVRFNTYRTVYYNDLGLSNGSDLATQQAAKLITKLTGGGFQPNPARSLMVGVIGLWREGEPAHEPGDRTLVPVGANPAGLGSAFVRVTDQTVTMDLSNSIPEIDRTLLTKKELGPISVDCVTQDGQVIPLATFDYAQYDRRAYEASAGIVTAPIQGMVGPIRPGSTLQLRQGPSTVLLTEVPIRVIPETPNLYLNEGDNVTARFQAYRDGVPLRQSIAVTVYEQHFEFPKEVMTTLKSTEMRTDAQGVLSVPVDSQYPEGLSHRVIAYVPVADASGIPAPGADLDTQTYTYMYARTIPLETAVGELPPTWDNVYCHVLANWNAMAPCMDNWLRLDDPAQIYAYKDILLKLTDPANFEDYLFMPVTRDMTQGERHLLWKFLKEPFVAPKTVAASATPATPERVSRRRSMR
ncbi:MAG: hypothetical protein WCC64_14255 [Aliidongia sp.]